MEFDYIKRKKEYDVLFLRVTKQEALRLIQSLSAQLVANNANVGREEMFTKDGTYVSIGVEQE